MTAEARGHLLGLRQVQVAQAEVVVPLPLLGVELDGLAKLRLGLGPATALEHLERPIRVCGMVRNEGEPGD